MFDLLATVLSWFYDLVPNYAVAIVLLTMAILLAVTPLTLKGTRSMLELQIHQPELKRIQTQYRDDRQRMNEELMKFYQEHKINPVGGCLPLLIQLPVFFILYNVIRGLNQRTDLLTSLLERGDASLAGAFDPKYLSESSALYSSLHGTNTMESFGVDLSLSFFQAAGQSFTKALPYLVLIIGATATSYYQQKQIQGRSNTQLNPQMQMITRVMPLFITVISLTLPAALTLYFLASGLYRIGQQAIITRHIYGPNNERLSAAQAASSVIDATAKDGDAAPQPGGFLGKLLGGATAGPATNGSAGGAKGSGSSNGKGSAGTSGPRPSGRVTPPGGPGNRPASSKKKKRK